MCDNNLIATIKKKTPQNALALYITLSHDKYDKLNFHALFCYILLTVM